MPGSGQRREGALAEPTGLRPGDHLCWTYASDYEHRRMLATFFAEGALSGDRMAYFAPRGRELRLVPYLEDVGLDPLGLVASGQLILGPAEEAFAPEGVFDPDERIDANRQMVAEAREAGYPVLRVAGEAGWILSDPDLRRAWPCYEMRADVLSSQVPFIAMCAYDLRECDRDAIKAMDALHSLTLNHKGPRSLFNVHVTTDGGIEIEGEVDISCSEILRTVLIDAIGRIRAHYIDVSGLTFADVDGARAIAIVGEALGDASGGFELRGASRSFLRLWNVVTLDQAVVN